ncbi:hypothetical protein [Labilibaculum euxinus]
MKRLIYCTAFLLVIIAGKQGFAQKQTFKPFKVEVGGILAFPLDKESGLGGGSYIEPRYSLNDNFTFGLRLEGVRLSSGEISVGIGRVNIDASTVTPVLFTCDYFFNNQKTRPFVGLGLGLYKRNDQSIDTDIWSVNINTGSENNFGFAPRIGLNVGHMRLAMIYNFTGNNISDYLSVQLGIEIGGGKKKQ